MSDKESNKQQNQQQQQQQLLLDKKMVVLETSWTAPPPLPAAAAARTATAVTTTSNSRSRETILAELISTTVRFSASDVAAMAGVHPYKNLAQLLHRLVYQGRTGALVLELDAQTLGLQLLDHEEEIWKVLATKAGTKTQQALQQVLTGQTCKSVQEAVQVQQRVAREAQASGKLSAAELNVLSEASRHTTYTRFGTDHEDNALNACRDKWGWDITERNAEIMEWPFRRKELETVAATGGDLIVTAEPIQDAKPVYLKRKSMDDVEDTYEIIKSATARNKRKRTQDRDQSIVDLTNCDKVNKENILEDFKQALRDAAAAEVTTKATTNATPDSKAPQKETSQTPSSSLSRRVVELVSSPLLFLGSWLGKQQPNATTALATVANDKHPLSPTTILTAVATKKRALSPTTIGEEAASSNNSLQEAVRTKISIKSQNQHQKYDENPFFVIRGAVDGIREELQVIPSTTATSTDAFGDDEWFLNRIVVELKHRMNRIYHTPPLYEQIQAVVYCFMYNVDGADIVQVMRRQEQSPVAKGKNRNGAKRAPPENEKTSNKNAIHAVKAHEAPMSTKITEYANRSKAGIPGCLGVSASSQKAAIRQIGESKSETEQIVPPPESHQQQRTQGRPIQKRELKMQFDRVSLEDPILRHRQNWQQIILPRLASFAEAVYAIRRDDSKRYRLLLACSDALGELEHDAWALLYEECPWLKSCDTAFNRKGKNICN